MVFKILKFTEVEKTVLQVAMLTTSWLTSNSLLETCPPDDVVPQPLYNIFQVIIKSVFYNYLHSYSTGFTKPILLTKHPECSKGSFSTKFVEGSRG